jgi:hypothetical protein
VARKNSGTAFSCLSLRTQLLPSAVAKAFKVLVSKDKLETDVMARPDIQLPPP